jgi:sulfatase modifying factor 1
MGAADGPHPEDGEGPVRQVFLDPFAIAASAVTNAEFSAFCRATGYRTLAERLGNSYVFHAFLSEPLSDPSAATVDGNAPWWHLVEGASWAAPDGPDGPDGPESTVAGREDHPVVHIAQEDALAYCHWSATRLPTEAEWEFAARGGLAAQPYPWGAALEPTGQHRMNIWQGTFPGHNTGADGYIGTAPVTAYEPNGFGLYNMTGNVWERVADRFTYLHGPRPMKNPRGPLNGADFVAKGGSYLCHASYCARYRTSSRQRLAAGSTTGHIGFRVAASVPAP